MSTITNLAAADLSVDQAESVGKVTGAAAAPHRMPIKVTAADTAFGGMLDEILPPMRDIPDEFLKDGNPWVKWQSAWFYSGLHRYPVAKPGIDLKLAMENLACVQHSWAPKHEHKMAGVAYLASLWFSGPDGEFVAAMEQA